MSLSEFIVEHENALRLGFFFASFAVMALWEALAPRRTLLVNRDARWANNLLLVFLNTLLLRLIVPVSASGMALLAAQQQWGLFHQLATPVWLALFVSLMLFDLAIYLQHRLFHALPWLWRLHRVHHADLDIDVSTGARFHPIEIVLSMLIKFAVIVALGPPLLAVIVFEITLNAMAMFNHANVGLPARLERAVRWLLVTPDVHRVHHSIEDDETNSNFGFCLSLWDRLFGSYRPQPRAGHQAMTIGLRGLRQAQDVTWLPGLLLLPFRTAARRQG